MKVITVEEMYKLNPGDLRAFGLVGMREFIVDDEDNITCSVEITLNMLNGLDTCQGGFLYTICDATCGAYLRASGTPSVTVNGSMNYYKAAFLGDVVTVSVHPRRMGRSLNRLLAEVHNQKGDLLCDAWFTFTAAKS